MQAEEWREEASWEEGLLGPGGAAAAGEADPCGSLNSEAGMELEVGGTLGVAQWVDLK